MTVIGVRERGVASGFLESNQPLGSEQALESKRLLVSELSLEKQSLVSKQPASKKGDLGSEVRLEASTEEYDCNWSSNCNWVSNCSGQGSKFFTVYQTEVAIELHPGCPDQDEYRVICTCLYYEQACEIARIAANLHLLPVQDFVVEQASA